MTREIANGLQRLAGARPRGLALRRQAVFSPQLDGDGGLTQRGAQLLTTYPAVSTFTYTGSGVKMAKSFMVAYDVTKAEREDYARIDEALGKLGKVISHEQGSVRWLSESSATAASVRDAVVRAVRRTVTVWVAEVGSDVAFHPPAK